MADEKEPDVRIRAKATDASVAIEIKIADRWTLSELDDALSPSKWRAVWVLLLAAGQSESEVLANYPGLTREDILACLSYVSYLGHEYRAFPIPA